jgi:hypothetical protein
MIRKTAKFLKTAFLPCEENNFRPKFLESRFLFLYVVVILGLKLLTIPVFFCFPRYAFFADITKSELINLINHERTAQGVQPLKTDSKLDDAAFLKASDILQKDYFAHFSPQGISPWYWIKKAGYNYQFAGENLAIGYTESQETHQSLLNSPTHRANLLSPNYTDVGISVLEGDFNGNKSVVVVQLFGTPRIVSAVSKQVEKITQTTKLVEPKTEIPEKLVQVAGTTDEKIGASAKIESKTAKETSKISNIFSFIISDYYYLIQDIIYYSLLIIIASLLLNIFIKFEIQYKDLILKAVIFIALLALVSFV